MGAALEKGILMLASCAGHFPGRSSWHRSSSVAFVPWDLPHPRLHRAAAALWGRVASELELAAGRRVQHRDCSFSLFLSPVHRCSGSSGGGHAAQLHGAGSDNLGDTRRNYPVCQTDLCGDAGGTVCNKGGKVYRIKPDQHHNSAASCGACPCHCSPRISRPLSSPGTSV